ncbi:hypothetical protein AFA91_09040 [Mycolicibacterium goodii]|uniref:Secreted protein n=2 Tax=Mycolicibacterium goodii TaxID=134601 RepID=A0A0K0X3I3_MYCGD|nr:hypothetical protein AFA91_09040 [Mycolicibacterium goodii]
MCAVAMAPVLAVLGLGAIGMGTVARTAAADPPSGPDMIPLQNVIRQCDFVVEQFLMGHGSGTGSGAVEIGPGAGGTVRADVRMQTLRPNTTYRVRLIQLPRPSVAPCDPGDPGVATTTMFADFAGNGSTTVTGPRQPGARQAWVVVEGPPVPGGIRGDVYSTVTLAPI